jgi:hypothetical protein
LLVFKTSAFNRSATSPLSARFCLSPLQDTSQGHYFAPEAPLNKAKQKFLSIGFEKIPVTMDFLPAEEYNTVSGLFFSSRNTYCLVWRVYLD